MLHKVFFALFCLCSTVAWAISYQFEEHEFDNHFVHVVTVDPNEVEMHLINCGGDEFDLKRVEDVAREKGAVIAINGGFFRADGSPAGIFYSKPLGKKTSGKVARGAIGWKNDVDGNLSFQFDLLSQVPPEWEQLDYAIGGAPLLINQGEIQEYEREKTISTFLTLPHARSLIGINQEGMLVLIKADGYEQNSVGFDMQELAEWLKELGLVYALNLDGGSSSTLFVDGNVFSEHEEKVGNALILVEKRANTL